MLPVWLLVAVAVVGVARGAASQCWEHPSCQEVNDESSMMPRGRSIHMNLLCLLLQECIQLCRSDLTAETPVIPGDGHLQPPPPPSSLSLLPSSSSSSPQAKRSYSMEHFRWGKPVGRKRRPIKVYTSNGVEEESAEVFPAEMRRRQLASEAAAAEAQRENDVHEKKDSTYKMKHFRWSGPPASKRYGGFMKSWDERSQRPLLTLFRNVIKDDGQEMMGDQGGEEGGKR
ncbi:pro-opiomelanocortin-like isoform X2 [Scophthalmus maximus]|uniref:pro-opiomelanocortin-like isoform X2 n=1 Tax=Scophthalmus maximus TaxID=52904 RepID=UPI001FA87446|nr:pro-opiomelanocortin-like isoform X2 [Scophthalmus maximus]